MSSLEVIIWFGLLLLGIVLLVFGFNAKSRVKKTILLLLGAFLLLPRLYGMGVGLISGAEKGYHQGQQQEQRWISKKTHQ